MVDINSQYYIPMRYGVAQAPLLNWHTGNADLQDEIAAPQDSLVSLCLANPVPKEPQMVDYLRLPDAVVSQKIKDVLEQFDLPGTQILRASIHIDESFHAMYWYLRIYQQLSGYLDLERSDVKLSAISKKIIPASRTSECRLEATPGS